MNMFLDYLLTAIPLGMTFLYGCTGEILTEKSGHLNLGIPGIMCMGGACGCLALKLMNGSNIPPVLILLITILAAFTGGILMGLIYSFLTVTLKANQNVTGLAMTTFGVGFGNFLGGSLVKLSGADMPFLALSATSNCFKKTLPFADKLGVIGDLFFSYSFLVYLAVIIALISSYIIKRTRTGLHLRAVGENPATADSAGINVNRYKYLATCLGCMVAGLGGLHYVMDYASGIWANNAFGDRGWLAIALVIFTVWRPNVGVLASYLFGGLYILHMYIPSGMNLAVKELYKMLPYVVTIIVLIISSLRNQRDKQPPQSLGLPYFREDR
jgi:simple sugar transport system permease protein